MHLMSIKIYYKNMVLFKTSKCDFALAKSFLESMSKKRNCWDNAVAESFFYSLKTELVYHEIFKTRAQSNQTIFEYIDVFTTYLFISPFFYFAYVVLKS